MADLTKAQILEQLAAANSRIKELEDGAIDDVAKEKIDALEAANRQLQDELDGASTTGDAPSYQLGSVVPGVERYDSVAAKSGAHIFHEKMSFAQDSGYSNAIKDRAKDAIERAFAPYRLHTDEKSVDYGRLPAFSKQGSLEVIVKVTGAES